MSTSGSTLKLVRQVTSADDGRISNIELDPSSTAEEADLFNLGGGAFDPGSTDTSPPRLIVTTLPIQFGDDHSMLECTLYGAADHRIGFCGGGADGEGNAGGPHAAATASVKG